MTNEDNLARSLAESVEAEASNLRNFKPPMTDFEKLLNAGEKLLRHQQDRAAKAETEYETRRTDLLNHYRSVIQAQHREAEEQLRQLDMAHTANMEQIARTITSLKGLRGS